MSAEKQLFESPQLNPLDFCVWGWMKCGFHDRKVNTLVELLAPISDVASRKNESDYQLK